MASRYRANRNAQRREFARPATAPHSAQSAGVAEAIGATVRRQTGGGGGGDCDDDSGAWLPSHRTAFKTLLSLRLCAAIWNNIQDCDETFNYWEPLHRLLYGGPGLLTWEYAPRYALRSYTYLALHAWPARLYAALLQPNRLLVFYGVRCALAAACAGAEVYLYGGVCRQLGAGVGRLTLLLLAGSAGMTMAAPALLPSSFAMVAGMVASGAWMRERVALTVAALAVATMVGWPFAVVLAVAPGVHFVLVRRRHLAACVLWSVACVAALLLVMLPIEAAHYGRTVFPPLNIVLYNVFSRTGANLYGTEPLSYYPLNLLLNFNVAFVLALLGWPLTALADRVCCTEPPSACAQTEPSDKVPRRRDSATSTRQNQQQQQQRGTICPHLLLSPLYLWLAVFCWQAHKEERFLYPAYPSLCVTAAAAIDALQRLWRHWCRGHRQWPASDVPVAALLALCVCASASRVIGQYRGYHAPLDTYMQLGRWAAPDDNGAAHRAVTVCVGREWHRYPSSFFLPQRHWRLGFVRSAFDGQLPRYVADSETEQQRNAGFNDANRAAPDSYTPLHHCRFLVDLQDSDDSSSSGGGDWREPDYSSQSANWTLLHSTPFLDAVRSPRLLRAFYVPFLTERYCHYRNYNLLERKK